MEGEADRDDLRFRLDWPEVELPKSKSEDALTDFSFEWDEQPVELALAETAEPQASAFEDLDEAAGDVLPPAVDEFAPVAEFAVVEEIYDPPLYDETDALDSVRRVLNEHNDALVQLSEAVAHLAANVRVLVEQGGTAAGQADTPGANMAASAMVAMSAEVTGAIDRLTKRFDATHADLQGLMDDVVAAAAAPTTTDAARVTVELERLRSEVQALKRRLPVRARELDAGEIADRVAEQVLTVLATEREAAPAPRRRAARPPDPDPDELLERPPRRAAAVEKPKPARRRAAEPDTSGAEYPVATAKRASRQRPLRAD